jgi:acyl carrier protein
MKYTREQIESKLRAMVAQQLHIDLEMITAEATLTSLGADSLDIVELVMHIEDEFGIEVSDEAAEKMHTLADVITYVDQEQNR